MSPHRIIGLVAAHLVQDKGLTGRVVKTLSTSVLVDRYAATLGLEVTTTPIGFKWIYNEMVKGDVLLGGEESGGIGIPSHVRERDGLLMALMLTEMMAQRGKGLGELVDDMLAITGPMEYSRVDLKLAPAVKDAFLARAPRSRACRDRGRAGARRRARRRREVPARRRRVAAAASVGHRAAGARVRRGALGGRRRRPARRRAARWSKARGDTISGMAQDRPMRVTMVNKYYYPPHLGGVETVVRYLSEGLVEHAGAQVRAVVSNEAKTRAEETIAGVDVIRLPRQFALSSAPIALGMAGELTRQMRSDTPPDVINLHNPYPWGELAWLQANPDVTTVLCYHSDIVRQKRMLAAYKPFLDRVLDRVDLITTSSPNLRDNSPFLRHRADKVRIVDYGLHVEDIAEPSPAVIARAEQIRAAACRSQDRAVRGPAGLLQGRRRARARDGRRRRRPGHPRHRAARERAARDRGGQRRDRRASASCRRRTTTSLRRTTAPPTCSACRAWPTARRSGSCRSRRTPPARLLSRPTCPPACPTPTSTA